MSRAQVAIVLGLASSQSVMAAPAGAMAIEGRVIETHSRWTADGTRIVTEATVRTASGDHVVSQLGGTVDGIGMMTFPGPEPLVVGMVVAVAATPSLDLAQREHLVVDEVRVLALPPAFVRTGPTARGNYLHWEAGCVLVTPDVAGTSQVVGNNEFEAIDRVVNEWNSKTAGCSYMSIELQPPLASEVGRDNVNLIKFRDRSWCRPAIGDDPARCYSPSAAGLTTAVFVDDANSPRDGAIVDADIEINGEHFAIAVNGQSSGTSGCQSDIANTLTHEVGHLLGLEHTCRAAGDPPRVDGQGRQVPLCSQTSDPLITEATMYNFQDCGETKKASLEADDISGICAAYPIAQGPKECRGVDQTGGGCANCSAAGSSGIVWGLVGAVWLWGATRKTRSRKSSR